jgi:hypothetical protein
MHAVMGEEICCPVCGRRQSAVELRAGEAWLICWHRRCMTTFWVVRLATTVPVVSDVQAAIGPRLADALLMTYVPAPLVMLAVPDGARSALTHGTPARLVARLTELLVPGTIVRPAKAPARIAH